ncbi:MAG: hypothetical protein AAFR61_27000 [Bacteroidota bacterium]
MTALSEFGQIGLKHYVQQFSPGIWRVWVDEVADLLVLELREGPEASPVFRSINWSGLPEIGPAWSPGQGKWATMAACFRGQLALQQYPDPGMPLSKGLYIYQAQKGEKLWTNPNLQFIGADADGWLARLETGEAARYAWQDGRELARLPLAEARQTAETFYQQQFSATLFPTPITHVQAAFSTWQKQIHQDWQIEVHLQLDWLAYERWQILHAYTDPQHQRYQRMLFLYQGTQPFGKLTLGRTANGLSLDPMMLVRGKLLFQPDDHHLAWLELLNEALIQE